MAHNSPKRHLITAALPYANGPIHIGHLAGAYLPADIHARYLRLQNKEVLFVSGSDEHGAAITLRAKKENKSPQEIVDFYHELNEAAFKEFGISFDIFHRTSSELHHQTASDFFKVLNEKGVFTKKTSEQFYDEEYKQFLADRYITGTCPKCAYEAAYGDQCEKCGSALSPLELINPISTLSKKSPVLRETTHWYLPMQQEEPWLKEWIEEGKLDGKIQHDPKTWRKQVIGQCKSWIDGGLHERAMTRDLNWGVKVPVENAEGKVLYVWLDAPIGYISATKQWCEDHAKNWEEYWKSEESEILHFIGKDNIVFHCIIFPIILKQHRGFNLPNNVPANEFLNLEGKKISTSRDWAVWLHEYNQDFKNQQDVLRYVLTSIAPETKDSEFTWSDFQARNNSELVAIYGNFVNRTLVLTHKYYEGIVPELDSNYAEKANIENQLQTLSESIKSKLDKLQYRDAQNDAIAIARLGNKFLAETEPWKLIKTNPEEVKSILNLSLQIAANACIALSPFLPDSSKRLADMLNLKAYTWSDLGNIELIKNGKGINEAEHLFSRIEDDIIEAQIQKLNSKMELKEEPVELSEIPEFKEFISFDDFMKLDIRVGEIKTAIPVKKSDKLLQLEVDLGNEVRTILSGIAKAYSPEELVGKQVQVLCNLPPRKMMGIESNGMILMAESRTGKLELMSPQQKTDSGSVIG
ncbi:MAG: methionine--tRNA ligase [Bacteroidetes bacterium]|nr:MAG: methionine--tRNA ligase [Bacteroidota bacterium]MBL1143820.1 methionine--tRNA ligase [Bacteroidota bacterium]NOG56621.1 methionine--tRNA ligase [Bacteroidota bacterium]